MTRLFTEKSPRFRASEMRAAASSSLLTHTNCDELRHGFSSVTSDRLSQFSFLPSGGGLFMLTRLFFDRNGGL